MKRRQALTMIGVGATGYLATAAFTAPACGPSKEKAVRVTGFVIELCKEAVPLLNLLGAQSIAEQVQTKAIPALEKLKDALASADVPTAGTTLQTLRSVLSGIGTALLNLPDSPRRTTILGILASVNVLLLTVEAFIESETPPSAMPESTPSSHRPVGQMIRQVYEASRP